MSVGVGDFQAKLIEKYLKGIFVLCYSHTQKLVPQHSVDNVKEYTMFFNKMSGLSSFFLTNTHTDTHKKKNAVSSLMSEKLLRLTHTKWKFL